MTAIKVLEDWKFTQWHETTGWVKGIYHQPHNGEMRRLVGNLHVYLVLRYASARALLWNTQYTIRISLKTKRIILIYHNLIAIVILSFLVLNLIWRKKWRYEPNSILQKVIIFRTIFTSWTIGYAHVIIHIVVLKTSYLNIIWESLQKNYCGTI